MVEPNLHIQHEICRQKQLALTSGKLPHTPDTRQRKNVIDLSFSFQRVPPN